jgi:HK97 gp10 family phage protein
MANSITIDVSQFSDFSGRFKGLEKELRSGVEGVLQKNAAALSLQAKQRAPTDIGGLKNSISAPVRTGDTENIEFTISVNVFYAAYMEFGTGKYAAQYVSTLPPDWQAYAASFRGKKGNEGMDKFLERIMDWVKRKGISGTYSVKTQKRTSAGGIARNFEDAEVAYFIALKILTVGVRPHPFLFPAYESIRPHIIKDIETLLKSLM